MLVGQLSIAAPYLPDDGVFAGTVWTFGFFVEAAGNRGKMSGSGM
jgi:hypothetical protein